MVLNEFPEEAVRQGHEIVVAAALAHRATVHRGYLVGIPNSAEPMGYRQNGPTKGGSLQGLLNQALRLRVQGACRLVQNQDLRVLKYGKN